MSDQSETPHSVQHRPESAHAPNDVAPNVLPEPIECTACSGEGGENVFERCATCEGAGVLIPCGRCGGAHPVGRPGPVGRTSPPAHVPTDVAREALVHLYHDHVLLAEQALSGRLDLTGLRLLGQHLDRLSMICFELASPAEHAPDVAQAFRTPGMSTSDATDAIRAAAERGLDRLREAYRHDEDVAAFTPAAPATPALPAPFLVTFEDPTEGDLL